MMFQLVIFLDADNGTFRVTSATPFTSDIIKGMGHGLLQCGIGMRQHDVDETNEVTLKLGEDALDRLRAEEE